jgi:hypothetical protein
MTTGGLIGMSDDAIDVNGEVEIVVVTMRFDAIEDEALHHHLRSVLSKYVVLARRPATAFRLGRDGRDGDRLHRTAERAAADRPLGRPECP